MFFGGSLSIEITHYLILFIYHMSYFYQKQLATMTLDNRPIAVLQKSFGIRADYESMRSYNIWKTPDGVSIF